MGAEHEGGSPARIGPGGLLLAACCEHALAGGWHEGGWDSTIYNLTEHPRTVALRVEAIAEAG